MWGVVVSYLRPSRGHYEKQPSNMNISPEKRKPVISNNFRDLVFWHGWAIVSVATSLTLICLNLTEYAIGGELGQNREATANILGLLQLVIKVHELAVTGSLVVLTRQLVQGILLDMRGGLPLGLVGCEITFGSPAFLISPEFYAALSSAISGNHRVSFIAVFLFLACVVSSLAGPASGVLMIPRVDWFFVNDLNLFHNTLEGITEDLLDPISDDYPNLMIDPQLGHGQSTIDDVSIWYSQDFPFMAEVATNYWSSLSDGLRNRLHNQDTDFTHVIQDYTGPLFFNSSTTWGRPTDGDWNGGSMVRGVFVTSLQAAAVALSMERDPTTALPLPRIKVESKLSPWLKRKYVTERRAIETRVECRLRPKVACPSPSMPSNEMHWCYLNGVNGDPMASVSPSQNLLVIGEHSWFRPDENVNTIQRVYLTEGPKAQHPYSRYSTSLQVLFEEGQPFIKVKYVDATTMTNLPINAPNITICTVTTDLKSAMVSSTSRWFSANYVEYANHFTSSDAEQEPPRRVLYHESWLDSLYAQARWNESSSYSNGTYTVTGNITYSPRNTRKRTANPWLIAIGSIVRFTAPNINPFIGDHLEAAAIEVPLGGALLFFFSVMDPTSSQYSIPPGVTLPASLMPERRRLYTNLKSYVVKVYHLGYGFRLSSRTGILGMVVLVTHAIMVLLASLWHIFWERKVIAAWKTIPDYLALGIGSTLHGGELQNTCAGIMEKETLQRMVWVGETTIAHLEVRIIDSKSQSITAAEPVSKNILSTFGAKYGYRGADSRVKEKIE